MILVATHTGFAPVWSIAVAALRENPERDMMIIAGGRTLESLYMWPALARLATFPNVHVVPVCSTPQTLINAVQLGRPTDYLPPLLPSDVLYACGAPAMVDSIKRNRGAHRRGLLCGSVSADRPTTRSKKTVLGRAAKWLTALTRRRTDPAQAYGMAEARVRREYRSQSA